MDSDSGELSEGELVSPAGKGTAVMLGLTESGRCSARGRTAAVPPEGAARGAPKALGTAEAPCAAHRLRGAGGAQPPSVPAVARQGTGRVTATLDVTAGYMSSAGADLSHCALYPEGESFLRLLGLPPQDRGWRPLAGGYSPPVRPPDGFGLRALTFHQKSIQMLLRCSLRSS